jgi:hypothetical protein
VISSSKSEYVTMAAIPASSRRRTVSRFRDSGEAEATSGFLRARPRYVVVKSGIVVLLYIGYFGYVGYVGRWRPP